MSKHTLGDGAVQPEYVEMMKRVSRAVDTMFNGPPGSEKKIGFVLMVFPFEDFTGRCNYMSNANRADVVVLLKEQLARFSGQADVTGRG